MFLTKYFQHCVSDIQMTTSQKGRPMIVVGGYRFGIHRVRHPKTYWYCHCASQGCHAIIHTLDDMTIIKCYNVHNH